MTIRSKMTALLLVASVGAAFSAPAMARDHRDDNRMSSDSWSLSINLGNNPQWQPIRGTRVYEMNGERPQYDAFRYGHDYYVYDNHQWYRSHRANGRFARIDDRSVPRDFRRVSRDHWRDSSWRDRWDRDRNNNNNQGYGHHS